MNLIIRFITVWVGHSTVSLNWCPTLFKRSVIKIKRTAIQTLKSAAVFFFISSLWVGLYSCHGVCVEVKWELVEVRSLHALCRWDTLQKVSGLHSEYLHWLRHLAGFKSAVGFIYSCFFNFSRSYHVNRDFCCFFFGKHAVRRKCLQII